MNRIHQLVNVLLGQLDCSISRVLYGIGTCLMCRTISAKKNNYAEHMHVTFTVGELVSKSVLVCTSKTTKLCVGFIVQWKRKLWQIYAQLLAFSDISSNWQINFGAFIANCQIRRTLQNFLLYSIIAMTILHACNNYTIVPALCMCRDYSQ